MEERERLWLDLRKIPVLEKKILKRHTFNLKGLNVCVELALDGAYRLFDTDESKLLYKKRTFCDALVVSGELNGIDPWIRQSHELYGYHSSQETLMALYELKQLSVWSDEDACWSHSRASKYLFGVVRHEDETTYALVDIEFAEVIGLSVLPFEFMNTYAFMTGMANDSGEQIVTAFAFGGILINMERVERLLRNPRSLRLNLDTSGSVVKRKGKWDYTQGDIVRLRLHDKYIESFVSMLPFADMAHESVKMTSDWPLYREDGFKNTIYGSTSPQSAEREIRIIFGDQVVATASPTARIPQNHRKIHLHQLITNDIFPAAPHIGSAGDIAPEANPANPGRALERTLALTPDAYGEGTKGTTMGMLKANGFEIVAQKEVRLSEDTAKEFHKEYVGKEYYEELVRWMSSGPVYAMVLEREDAVSKCREIWFEDTTPECTYCKTHYSEDMSAKWVNLPHEGSSVVVPFHETCVFEWFYDHDTCPHCRATIIKPPNVKPPEPDPDDGGESRPEARDESDVSDQVPAFHDAVVFGRDEGADNGTGSAPASGAPLAAAAKMNNLEKSKSIREICVEVKSVLREGGFEGWTDCYVVNGQSLEHSFIAIEFEVGVDAERVVYALEDRFATVGSWAVSDNTPGLRRLRESDGGVERGQQAEVDSAGRLSMFALAVAGVPDVSLDAVLDALTDMGITPAEVLLGQVADGEPLVSGYFSYDDLTSMIHAKHVLDSAPLVFGEPFGEVSVRATDVQLISDLVKVHASHEHVPPEEIVRAMSRFGKIVFQKYVESSDSVFIQFENVVEAVEAIAKLGEGSIGGFDRAVLTIEYYDPEVEALLSAAKERLNFSLDAGTGLPYGADGNVEGEDAEEVTYNGDQGDDERAQHGGFDFGGLVGGRGLGEPERGIKLVDLAAGFEEGGPSVQRGPILGPKEASDSWREAHAHETPTPKEKATSDRYASDDEHVQHGGSQEHDGDSITRMDLASMTPGRRAAIKAGRVKIGRKVFGGDDLGSGVVGKGKELFRGVTKGADGKDAAEKGDNVKSKQTVKDFDKMEMDQKERDEVPTLSSLETGMADDDHPAPTPSPVKPVERDEVSTLLSVETGMTGDAGLFSSSSPPAAPEHKQPVVMAVQNAPDLNSNQSAKSDLAEIETQKTTKEEEQTQTPEPIRTVAMSTTPPHETPAKRLRLETPEMERDKRVESPDWMDLDNDDGGDERDLGKSAEGLPGKRERAEEEEDNGGDQKSERDGETDGEGGRKKARVDWERSEVVLGDGVQGVEDSAGVLAGRKRAREEEEEEEEQGFVKRLCRWFRGEALEDAGQGGVCGVGIRAGLSREIVFCDWRVGAGGFWG
ncbi:hypothetical protein HK097_011223 [Rhizophlyctis rosea]|uniref:Nucleoside diphosphate kinase n=1 Tax=Rhizophlyctis rosea TaxID=64517 RepID=A0AAD5X390_9FUNG|nr:hypothetical protein HK097_011223 [Rhizophlyctis rosea]